MLDSKGHKNVVKMLSDPVQVEIMAKKNEEVTGTGDNTLNGRTGTSLY